MCVGEGRVGEVWLVGVEFWGSGVVCVCVTALSMKARRHGSDGVSHVRTAGHHPHDQLVHDGSGDVIQDYHRELTVAGKEGVGWRGGRGEMGQKQPEWGEEWWMDTCSRAVHVRAQCACV